MSGPPDIRMPPVAFATATADILTGLARAADGATLARTLGAAVEQVRTTPVTIARAGHDVFANDERLAVTASRVWREHLESHALVAVEFSTDVSERELLHFLALLGGPADSMAFKRLWTSQGAWHIHVCGVADAGARLPLPDPAALALVNEVLARPLEGPNARGVGRADLDRLAALVRAGVPAGEADPLGRALQRAGPQLTAVLLEELAVASSGVQRRRLFEALRQLRDGHTHLITALQHPEWFVVRNAAQLIGELHVTSATFAVGALLQHPDSRVRSAAASSLAALATVDAWTLLNAAPHDPAPHVRQAVWEARATCGMPPDAACVEQALRAETDARVKRAILRCIAVFPSLEVSGGLLRFCARELDLGRATDLVLFAVELLARLRPASARPLLRRLTDGMRAVPETVTTA